MFGSQRFGSKRWFGIGAGCAALLGLLLVTAMEDGRAAPARTLIPAPGTDYAGHDYATLREVDLDACQRACLEDARCRAFTFNVKAGWCFLKASAADPRPFAGAVSGRIADPAPDPDDQPARAATRALELRFLPGTELTAAQALAERIARATPAHAGRAALAEAGRQALGVNAHRDAADRFAAALRAPADAAGPDDRALWLALATALSASQPEDWQTRQQVRGDARAAAIQAYLHGEHIPDRAAALTLLARVQAGQTLWREALRTARAALDLSEDPTLRAEYEAWRVEHGFRVVEHRVDAEAASPRICLRFSAPLDRAHAGLADFARVADHPELPVEIEDQQICIDGVLHGERYRVQVRAGLPAADGETLARAVDLELYVRDRAPLARFPGRAYVLPRGGAATLPVISVNTSVLEARVYRVGDRALARAVTEGTVRGQLDTWDAEELAERTGEAVWTGQVEVRAQLNREVTTAVPVGALVPDLKPGIHALTARPANAPEPDTLATQWFLVSDLGLATFSGNDGLHVLARALGSARPVAAVALRLIAVNNEILGTATADAAGYARFAPGLLRGTGGNAPALLVAESADGDYGFLDLTQPPFDLSDRGVTGRPPPQPLDVYLVSDRGAYRPGETVHLTALVRDARALAVPELPLLLILKRPDGVEHSRLPTQDGGQGGHRVDLALAPAAMRGTWHAALHGDPKAPPLAELAFLVEDFDPERLTFDLSSSTPALDPADPPAVTLDGRFLHGAPAADLDIEGTLRLTPTDQLPGFAGYRFGLASEEVEPVAEPLAGARTDAAGRAVLPLTLPAVVPTSRPLEATLEVRVLEASGRPVERTLTLPVAARQARIGIRPLFAGAVEDGGNARFEILRIGADGTPVRADGLRWTLSRLTTRFQWSGGDGDWDYEAVVSSQRVADGTLTAAPDAPADTPIRIEAPVAWGAYRLTLTAPDGSALPADLDFTAGWYVAPTALDTPDLLRVSLDRPRYRIGDTAQVRIEARTPGLALVMVVDDRLIAMRAIEVPAAGASVDLPVTADWGPGAYVTAVLYRPMDLAERRMPARALGLTWAGVEPGARRLVPRLGLDATRTIRPRQRLEIPVDLGPEAAGQDVRVTVSAVDLGILNLTRHPVPDPEGWYFGQRRLGMEIRDLYGQLIDRMAGEPGRVRAGGDGDTLRLAAPPPTEPLLAFQSDILALDAQGRARVAFDLPAFNGTVRVTALAWSQEGVGHAVQEILVRDPVVVQTALPRFLAPGDRSRLLLELTHVEGPAGDIKVQVHGSAPEVVQVDPAAASQTPTLAEHGRARMEIPLAALASGASTLTITLRTPDGSELTRALNLTVRSHAPPIARTQIATLAPGAEQRWDATALDGLLPGTGTLLAAVSGAGRLDIPGLLMALDRYPYGCTEQLVSRALPLLYLDRIALGAGLAKRPGEKPGEPMSIDERVRAAIAEVLANQGSNGGFGLWGADGGESGDTWLDAYATDFLSRARAQGYAVPDAAFENALDNLRNRLSWDADSGDGGADAAYALHVLARDGRAAIGDPRHAVDNRLETFATPLARAQLGAALAFLGDPGRAATAFRSALDLLEDSDEDTPEWRADYGSARRDGAALLALAAESGIDLPESDRIRRLTEGEGGGRDDLAATSTQEQAWLLLAAQALMHGAARPRLEVDGQVVDGPLFRRLDEATLAARSLTIRNHGARPQEAVVTVTGIPREPPPAGGAGYRIERAWYDPEGRRVQPSEVRQGARLIAVLTVTADPPRQARLIVDDPLPAGFEIDNPHLLRAGELDDLDWLDLQEVAEHTEFRAERFVAAVDRGADAGAVFQLAYRLRAVAPGVFAQPAAQVVDMYRPQLRAWTDTGRVTVAAPERTPGKTDEPVESNVN